MSRYQVANRVFGYALVCIASVLLAFVIVITRAVPQ